MKTRLLIGAFALFFSSVSSAGIITGGTYLDDSGANQLENWLGVGDQDFTNIWSGGRGATASSFHTTVDGAGATFSIYEMTIHDGSTAYIGGYTAVNWASSGYKVDLTAFIFNLTSGEVQHQVDTDAASHGQHSIYAHSNYFATFGGGHDLFGGTGVLGSGSDNADGYTYSHTYEISKGQISVAGDSGSSSGNSGSHFSLPVVTGLQVFTFADAQSVPEPSVIALFAAGLFGTGFARRRMRS